MIENLKKFVRKKNNYIFWITNPNLINIEIAIEKNFFDIFVVDYEHSIMSLNEIRSIITLLNIKKIPIFMRFAKFNIHEIHKFLDFGINGIILSTVNSQKQLNLIKNISLYPKTGSRGVGLGRMNRHGENFKSYLDDKFLEILHNIRRFFIFDKITYAINIIIYCSSAFDHNLHLLQ